MKDDVQRKIQPYLSRGVIIDTNILLLLFAGSFRPALIPRFKRTDKFKEKDFEVLVKFFKPFNRLLTTPNILTEVNSLSNQLSENIKPAYARVFAEQVGKMSELYVPSVDLVAETVFAKFSESQKSKRA